MVAIVKRCRSAISSNLSMKPVDFSQPPLHGGDLERAQGAFSQTDSSHSSEPWLDLSAGLNPNPWPVPSIPNEYFARLPESYTSLLRIAGQYYQQPSLYPVNGSQQVIELLPKLRPFSVVAVPTTGYAEHAWCWHKSGHQVKSYQDDSLEQVAKQSDVVIVINPNNPSGRLYSRQELLLAQQELAKKGGWLIVDEAFMDALDDDLRLNCSISKNAQLPGVFVLRSVGKFFGLAGIRSGFVLSAPENINRIKKLLGPWHLSGTTSFLTEKMLTDITWQQQSRKRFQAFMLLQEQALDGLGEKIGSTPLFYTCYHPEAKDVQKKLAQQGVWVRYFVQESWLRFGLTANERELERLSLALKY